jgi:hypothetical protein
LFTKNTNIKTKLNGKLFTKVIKTKTKKLGFALDRESIQISANALI